MWNCETCGKSVRQPRPQGTDATEDLGRRFFGLAARAPLCAHCLEGVRTVGGTVWEVQVPNPCPACRARVGSAWSSPEFHPHPDISTAPGIAPPLEPAPNASPTVTRPGA